MLKINLETSSNTPNSIAAKISQNVVCTYSVGQAHLAIKEEVLEDFRKKKSQVIRGKKWLFTPWGLAY